MMKRSLAACALTALALGVTGAASSAAAPAAKPAGCPFGGWTGPQTTLQVATWNSHTYGDGTEADTALINADLQQRADRDGDGYVCYKVNAGDRLPEPAQEHFQDVVLVNDARSSAHS
jgi:hypothetical protein